MNYISTRGKAKPSSFKDAVMTGLAEDGGLLLPSSFPKVELEKLKGKSYVDLSFEVIRPFADDIPPNALRELLAKSYASFDDARVAPLIKLKNFRLLELFHGPTYAFKDIALQFLGNLFEYILKERGENLNILGATSGDTGSAAIMGARGKDKVKIAILYPLGRVSPVQEQQMLSVEEENTCAYAVKGSFDDCQTLVKECFNDLPFKSEHRLGAVNSINWARILAQTAYYFYAYLNSEKVESLTVSVPTGNFGNIFAGCCARFLGLPLKLLLATNANNILHRFVREGDYSIREVAQTLSPSMDIQLASNLERYLYYLYSQRPERVIASYEELKAHGKITFSKEEREKISEDFLSADAANSEIEEEIGRTYREEGYILDPHTACAALAVRKLNIKDAVVLATAHPAKFPEAVERAARRRVDTPKGLKAPALRKRIVLENDLSLVKEELKRFYN